MAEQLDVSVDNIIGKKRVYAKERHITWYILNKVFKMPYVEILLYFNASNHTSVLHGIRATIGNGFRMFEVCNILEYMQINKKLPDDVETETGIYTDALVQIKSLQKQLAQVIIENKVLKTKLLEKTVEADNYKTKVIKLYSQSNIVNKITQA